MRYKSKTLALKPNTPGRLTLICDSFDDLYGLYNILSKGDFVKMQTTRRVEAKAGKSVKKSLSLVIKIEIIEFFQEDQEIRIRGTNRTENDFISLGQFHTFSITTGVFFTLFKVRWSGFQIEALEQACNPDENCDLGVILMEEGLANFFIIGNNCTHSRGTVTKSIPKNKGIGNKSSEGLQKFHKMVYDHMCSKFILDKLKCIVVASPGFTKDNFRDWLKNSGIKIETDKLIYVHVSSGYKQSLSELMKDKTVLSVIKETKAIRDVNAINDLNDMMGVNVDLVVFGRSQVETCLEEEACKLVMLTDSYMRKLPIKVAVELSKKLNGAAKSGCEVIKMSSMHFSGESCTVSRN